MTINDNFFTLAHHVYEIVLGKTLTYSTSTYLWISVVIVGCKKSKKKNIIGYNTCNTGREQSTIIQEESTTGPLDCAHYNNYFVTLRFCSIHVTATLAIMPPLPLHYTEDVIKVSC